MINTYSSLRDAGNSLNICDTTIGRSLNRSEDSFGTFKPKSGITYTIQVLPEES